MGHASKKINKKYLEEKIQSERIKKFIYAGDCEVYGRACMYLDKQEESINAFKKAAELEDILIERIKLGSAVGDISREVHRKANFLRLAGEVEEAKAVYREAKEMYEQLLEENKYPYSRKSYMIEYLDTMFFLKEYEKCIEYNKECPMHYAIAYSKGILNNDNELIGETIERIKKDAKNEKVGPGEESGVTSATWDWYEIGLKLLGLPSRIDYIDW
ncbi:hypothetical protein BH721_03720 [Clostridium baratii]|uniref:hypothetical protein n=1 Tax=Clostridium baratii TaxID=1561 RepID=UPI0009A340EE|nr:hypothetical protein [Clostridium baratii]OPF52374.1 hypothetical protein A1M12_09925 [Clostridium baratii]OPF55824.1 hypothetical protein BH721_03720 [Clostridium baratii]OPF56796.1 hypothetical protein BH724_09705 [Clostridium baratii]OPF59795.1 hypothetical protein BH725_04205 [Clostridium baratii]